MGNNNSSFTQSFYDSFSFVPPTVNFISQYIMIVINIIGFIILFYPVFFPKGKFSPPSTINDIYGRIANSLPDLKNKSTLQKITQNRIINFVQFACVILFLFTVVGIVNTILNSFGIYSFVNFTFYVLPIILIYIPVLMCVGFLFLKSDEVKTSIANAKSSMDLIRHIFSLSNKNLNNSPN